MYMRIHVPHGPPISSSDCSFTEVEEKTSKLSELPKTLHAKGVKFNYWSK